MYHTIPYIWYYFILFNSCKLKNIVCHCNNFVYIIGTELLNKILRLLNFIICPDPIELFGEIVYIWNLSICLITLVRFSSQKTRKMKFSSMYYSLFHSSAYFKLDTNLNLSFYVFLFLFQNCYLFHEMIISLQMVKDF